MSILLGYAWLDHTAYWAWVVGMVMGGFLGMLVGQRVTWVVLRNPLAWLFRAYRVLWADCARLVSTGRWT